MTQHISALRNEATQYGTVQAAARITGPFACAEAVRKNETPTISIAGEGRIAGRMSSAQCAMCEKLTPPFWKPDDNRYECPMRSAHSCMNSTVFPRRARSPAWLPQIARTGYPLHR